MTFDAKNEEVYALGIGYSPPAFPLLGTYAVDNETGADRNFEPYPSFGVYTTLGVDPLNGQLIASSEGLNGSTEFLSPQSGNVVQTFPFYTSAIAFDSSTNSLLLSTLSSERRGPNNETWFSNATWVNGTSDAIVRSIELWNNTSINAPMLPPSAAFDPDDGNWFVGTDAGNLSVFNGSTGATLGTIALGFFPGHVTFDPVSRNLYLSGEKFGMNPWGLGVTVLNANTWRVIGNVSGLASQPWYGSSMVVDPKSGLLFLSENTSIVEVNATSDAVVGSFITPVLLGNLDAEPLAFDTANHRLYVAGGSLANLVVEPGLACSSTGSNIPQLVIWLLLVVVAVALMAVIIFLDRRQRRLRTGRPTPKGMNNEQSGIHELEARGLGQRRPRTDCVPGLGSLSRVCCRSRCHWWNLPTESGLVAHSSSGRSSGRRAQTGPDRTCCHGPHKWRCWGSERGSASGWPRFRRTGSPHVATVRG